MNGPMRTFSGPWWSVRLPYDWYGSAAENGFVFRCDRNKGELRISSAKKESGVVSWSDLMEYSADSQRNVQLAQVTYEHSDGLSSERVDGELYWREWWLRSGNLLTYATYVVNLGSRDFAEECIAEAIVRSVKENP